jgi:PTH1 family peptidyl-tRNA hydrolase
VWLIVGLGNPGPDYEHTRHNIGFMAADELARRWHMNSWKSKFGGEVAQKDQTVLLKPQEYMNVSGAAVQRTAAFYKIEANQIIVLHDEIDLPFGKLRVKVGGGHGGHNGLRSILAQMGESFLRVRCGVGKPEGGKERVTGHVLGGFSKSEQTELPFLVGGAADAVDLILQKGPIAAMNQVNTDKPRS